MQHLNKSPEFYDTIDLIITPVIIADKNNTHCQYVNKAFLKQIGYQLEDIPDQAAWFNVVHPNEQYRSEVKAAWKNRMDIARSNGDSHLHMLTKVCCADGTYKWFDIHESIFGAEKVITFLDVDEMQEQYEELTNVLKEKDILLSIIAHDVRSPLATIRQLAENMQEFDLEKTEINEIFSVVTVQIDYIFNIINSLLIRTSSERGSFIEKKEPINLSHFFAKYTAYYRDRMEKNKVSFVFDIPFGAEVDFDPFVLDVISRNLIDNAIKYSPANGEILISYVITNGHTDITIKDNGPGMSQAQIDTILDNLGSCRLKNQITDSFGLGLVMAKEILERQEGKLLIESTIGQGTRFIVRIDR